MLEIELLNSPRLCIGTEIAMMVGAPDLKPALPRPATARPIMKTTELGAVAQITEPTSKRRSADKYIHLMRKYLYIFPYVGCMAQLESR